jgi:hypothetical protein
MGIVVPSHQQHTCSTYLLVLAESGSLVSNLLALFLALPIEQARDFCASTQYPPHVAGLAQFNNLGSDLPFAADVAKDHTISTVGFNGMVSLVSSCSSPGDDSRDPTTAP